MLSICYTTLLFLSSVTPSHPSTHCPLPVDYTLPARTVNASQMAFFTKIDNALLQLEWASFSEKGDAGRELIRLMHIREEQVAEELLYTLKYLETNRAQLLFSSDAFRRKIDQKQVALFDIIFLYKSLGKAYIEHGHFAKGVHLYGEALWLSQLTFGEHDRVSAAIYNRIGNYYGLRGDYDTCLFCYENALDALQADDRYANELRGRVYYNMAETYRKTFRYKEAGELYKKSGRAFLHYYGISDRKTLRSYYMRYIVTLGSSLTLALTLLFFAYKLLPCIRHVHAGSLLY